jgi:hypothetical protein
MTDVRAVQSLSTQPYFDRGIDSVVEAWEPIADYLPDRGDITPSELANVGELKTILEARNLDLLLNEWAAIRFSNLVGLTPSAFRTTLGNAQVAFRMLAGAQADLKRKARLQRGERELAEHNELVAYVQGNLLALVQG